MKKEYTVIDGDTARYDFVKTQYDLHLSQYEKYKAIVGKKNGKQYIDEQMKLIYDDLELAASFKYLSKLQKDNFLKEIENTNDEFVFINDCLAHDYNLEPVFVVDDIKSTPKFKYYQDIFNLIKAGVHLDNTDLYSVEKMFKEALKEVRYLLNYDNHDRIFDLTVDSYLKIK